MELYERNPLMYVKRALSKTPADFTFPPACDVNKLGKFPARFARAGEEPRGTTCRAARKTQMDIRICTPADFTHKMQPKIDMPVYIRSLRSQNPRRARRGTTRRAPARLSHRQQTNVLHAAINLYARALRALRYVGGGAWHGLKKSVFVKLLGLWVLVHYNRPLCSVAASRHSTT